MNKDQMWLAMVPLATFLVTWAIGKIPPLPKQVLPFVTPVAGLTIGFVLKWADAAQLPWWSTAGAGAIATTIYEGIKNLTKAGPDSVLTPTPKPVPVVLPVQDPKP